MVQSENQAKVPKRQGPLEGVTPYRPEYRKSRYCIKRFLPKASAIGGSKCSQKRKRPSGKLRELGGGRKSKKKLRGCERKFRETERRHTGKILQSLQRPPEMGMIGGEAEMKKKTNFGGRGYRKV